MIKGSSTRFEIGTWLLVAGSAIGLAISVFDYFGDIGIRGTAGAILVTASSALILGAALATGFVSTMPTWLGVLLAALLIPGILGTALAAYFLDAGWLLAAMALAMIGWLLRFAVLGEREPRHSVKHIYASSTR